jgi:hypothetical protein
VHLYIIREHGLIAITAIANPWCNANPEHETDTSTYSISSATHSNDQALNQPPPSNCFLWDGFKCTRPGTCNFNHPSRIDTRRTQSPTRPSRSTFNEQTRSRSRSRDRSQDQNGFNRYRDNDNHYHDNDSRSGYQRINFRNSNDYRRNEGNDRRGGQYFENSRGGNNNQRSFSSDGGGKSDQRADDTDYQNQRTNNRSSTIRYDEASRSPSPFAGPRRESPAPAPRHSY